MEAVRAADQFLERRLWLDLDGAQVVGVEIEGEPPIAVSVMGSGGAEFGLHALVGENAVSELLRAGLGELSAHEIQSKNLSFGLVRRVEIEPPFDRPLVQAGRQGRMVPMFFAAELGEVPRLPRKPEFELLIRVTRALLIADAGGRLAPGDPRETGRLLVLRVGGDCRDLQVSSELRDVSTALEFLDEGDGWSLPGLVDLPIRDASYCAALVTVPVGLGGEGEAVRALLLLDTADDTVVALEVLRRDESNGELAERLALALHSGGESTPPGLPRKMVFLDAGLYRELVDELEEAGVDCAHEPASPEVDRIVDELTQALKARSDSLGATIAREPTGADDLDGWKDVERRVTERLLAAGARVATENAKAWRKYLGVDAERREALEDRYVDGLWTGYFDWYAHQHRGSKRARTLVERVLREDLPAAEREVLLARDGGVVSMFRVERVDVGESVVFRDVLQGRRHEIRDTSLSLTAKKDMVFPARVYAVANFEFAIPIGPVLLGAEPAKALDFLERECGLRLDGAVDPGGIHLLGRMWDWSARCATSDVRLQNHSGDELRWHCGEFSVANSERLREALASRDDVEELEGGVQWQWHRAGLHLGSLELFGNEFLFVEVNSPERFGEVRNWIESIEGVEFERLSESELP